MNSTQLFLTLLSWADRNDIKERTWSAQNSFEVVIGAVLVQNTSWQNTQKALENLRKKNALNLDAILSLNFADLAALIKPSGFYNTKAKRLLNLCAAIKREFGDFENFKQNVSREWLLNIKGIGEESADAILAYACARPVMVVDAYARRILNYLNYEFESYDEAKEWLSSLEYDKIYSVLGSENFDETEILKLYHMLILEFAKANFRGKILSEQGKMELSNLV